MGLSESQLKRLAELAGAPASDPTSAESREYAGLAYKRGWEIYIHHVDSDGVKHSEIEEAFDLFASAWPLLELQERRDDLPSALRGLSITAGMLGKASLSRKALRRCIEILLPKVHRPMPDWKALEWMMKSMQSLAEGADTLEERLESCARGLEYLAKLNPGDRSPRWTRYKALFFRAKGAALTHKGGKSQKSLSEGEAALKTSIGIFRAIDLGKGKWALGEGKVHKELSRNLRAQAALAEGGLRKELLERAMAEIAACFALFQSKNGVSQWNHFHKAKILRDQGDADAALSEVLTAVRIIEENREAHDQDDNRISFQEDKLAVYDLGIYLAHELHKPEIAFELSQRGKARVFVERMRGKTPVTPTTTTATGSILTHAQLSRHLNEREALVEYHVGSHAVSIFVVTAEGLSFHRRICRKADLEQLVQTFNGFMRQAPDARRQAFCLRTLAAIAKIVVAPIEGVLKDCRHLSVVPSQPLTNLPFSALPMSDGTPLVEHLSLCSLPHSALLPHYARTRPQPREMSLLILANPDGSLIYADDEAAEVAGIVGKSACQVRTGREANKRALRELQKGLTHLHIACHGEYIPEDELGSHLILSPEDGDDGILKVQEIFGLPLEGVDLAFLSCCKTAWGRHKGCDEIEGVHRAFLHAGARSVIVTFWDIDDRITRKLAARFYDELKAGRSKSEALRQAQLSIRQQAGCEHPYYWAAFKLVGCSG